MPHSGAVVPWSCVFDCLQYTVSPVFVRTRNRHRNQQLNQLSKGRQRVDLVFPRRASIQPSVFLPHLRIFRPGTAPQRHHDSPRFRVAALAQRILKICRHSGQSTTIYIACPSSAHSGRMKVTPSSYLQKRALSWRKAHGRCHQVGVIARLQITRTATCPVLA